VSGRQRALSQTVVKLAIAMQVTPTDQRTELARELQTQAACWKNVHEGLQRGNHELMLPGLTEEGIAARFAEIDPSFRTIHDAALTIARTVLERPDAPRSELRVSSDRIQAHEQKYFK